MGYQEVVEEVEDAGLVDWCSWGGNAVDAIGSVGGAPGLDEATKGVVGGEVGILWKGLLRDGARHVVVDEEPPLDALAVVGDASHSCDRVLHDFERDGADVILRDFN